MAGKGGPRLLAVCGLPGSGKSTVSRILATRLGAVWLRTDVIRKELFPAPTYSAAESARVYDRFFAQARRALQGGDSVVLDATFSQAAGREQARAVAEEWGCPFCLVHVVAPEHLIRRRLEERRNDPSDADFGVYRALSKTFAPFAPPVYVLQNQGTVGELEKQVGALLDHLACSWGSLASAG